MLIEHLSRQRREREAQSLRRRRRIVETPCAPRVRLADHRAEDRADDRADDRAGHGAGVGTGREGRTLLAFCSNDYLGLAGHPALAAALAEGARLWGTGSGASPLVSGHTRAHADLEAALAAFLAPVVPGAQALLFDSGWHANLALTTTLGDAHATLFADRLNHASLVDGGLLARAPLRRYAHARTDVLDGWLARCLSPVKLIVTDAVFSMDGDIAPLPELLALAERHDAWLVVDDAHGFGVLGPQGRGTAAHFGLSSRRLILMGTLGKAAGMAGAFVVAHPVVIDALAQSARTYVYSTAMPPAQAHALQAALALLCGAEGDAGRARLAGHVAALRRGLGPLAAAMPGWSLPASRTAIQPLVVGDNAAALALSAALEARGLWVPAIRPPTVPDGSARLRISLGAAHTEDDVAVLIDALSGTLEAWRAPS